MFTELQLSGELRLRLAGAVVNGACIDQAGMSLALRLTTRAELGDAELEELKHLLMGVYGFRQVTTEVTCKAPSSQAAAAGSRPAASVPAAPSGSKGEKQAAGKVLMGKPIRIQPVPMKILDLKMGNATVAGKVFAFECRETRRPGMWRLSFDMTDYTNSVTVQKNLTEKEAQGLESAIKPGMWLCVQGKMEPTWDGKDIQLNPYHIQLAEHTERQDTAPEKRVELHLHTKMSNMDALTDTKEVVQQAIRWGHPAIAITDHGVAQSFPDAWHAAGDKIKILYGVEGYFVNNIDDRVVVHGPQDCSLDGEFVCFDIETTGLKVDREAITEIGAVVLKNGEITDRFQTFVNPNRRLTPEIIGLTGIAAKSAELIEKAREGRLTEADYHGGTFTVSSLGMFDLDDFVAIINPPESAILAVGKIAKTPVVVTDDEGEDQVVIKSMCALCLSYDHRIIDGAEAAKFLQKLKSYLQNPILLI